MDPLPGTPAAPRLALSQCTGFLASGWALPNEAAPGRPPPGWEPAPGGFSAVNVGGAECRRVHLGPFERGPVRLVWDSHNNADVPPACAAGEAEPTAPHVLNALVVDDPALAAHLHAAYGMPAFHAAIEAAAEPLGALALHRWAWNPSGDGSTVRVLDDGTNVTYEGSDRFWWPRDGGGLGQLDLSYHRWAQAVTGRPADGTLQPPMLVPPPDGRFEGSAVHFPAFSGEGWFRLYADPACTQPEPGP